MADKIITYNGQIVTVGNQALSVQGDDEHLYGETFQGTIKSNANGLQMLTIVMSFLTPAVIPLQTEGSAHHGGNSCLAPLYLMNLRVPVTVINGTVTNDSQVNIARSVTQLRFSKMVNTLAFYTSGNMEDIAEESGINDAYISSGFSTSYRIY